MHVILLLTGTHASSFRWCSKFTKVGSNNNRSWQTFVWRSNRYISHLLITYQPLPVHRKHLLVIFLKFFPDLHVCSICILLTKLKQMFIVTIEGGWCDNARHLFMIQSSTTSNEKTFQQDFLDILMHTLQNFKKNFKKCVSSKKWGRRCITLLLIVITPAFFNNFYRHKIKISKSPYQWLSENGNFENNFVVFEIS